MDLSWQEKIEVLKTRVETLSKIFNHCYMTKDTELAQKAHAMKRVRDLIDNICHDFYIQNKATLKEER